MPPKISTTKTKIIVKKKVLAANQPPSPIQKEENIEENIEELIQQYICSLSKEEKQTMEIAKSHLGTSFNIKRSIGYLNWKSSQ